MGAIALFSGFTVTVDFIRHVYLAYDHTYWWERLHVGWVGERISIFTAWHVSAHIPGVMMNPIQGWEWIHFIISLLVIGSCLGAVWFLGILLIQQFTFQRSTGRAEHVVGGNGG